MNSARTTMLFGWCTALLTAACIGCQPAGAVKISLVPADRSLQERIIVDESFWTGSKVALIDISGLLVDEYRNGLLSEGEHPVAFLAEQLEKAKRDPAVKAIVLRINSPGGTVTASSLIHDEIRRFRVKTGKPCVALLMDVAASGGYYVACAADRIIAHRSTVTGSIGVIMQLFSLQQTLAKIGVKTFAIKSGRYKDAGSPLRDLTDDERKLFQKVINEFYEQFVEAVDAGRPNLNRRKIRQLADGRIYTAQQALEAGLIDEIGDFHTALDWVKKSAGLATVKVVVYHRPLQYRPNIYATAPTHDASRGAPLGSIRLSAATLEKLLRPKFLYLWAPGLAATTP